MTIRELRRQLATIPNQDRLVILSKDAEGNGYSPLAGCEVGAYAAETTWSGQAGLEALTDASRAQGYRDHDVVTDGVPALILCPIN